MNLKDRWLATKAVHAGERRDPPIGPVSTPIYETSVFVFSSTQELIDVVSQRKEGYLYTRFDNPTVTAVEKKMSELEGVKASAAFSSGMAAIASTLFTLVSSGDHIVTTQDIYGGTISLFTEMSTRFGVDVSWVEATDVDAFADAVCSRTKAIYVETPTNPTLKLVDLAQLSKLGEEKGIPVIVDSTFATPHNMRPALFGVDVIVHSATKYLGGHNDVTAGVVCGKTDFIQKLKGTRKMLGGTLDPMAAWLLLRGLKTLDVRMQRHNANTMKVAQWLEKHSKVNRVYYPGLESHPQNGLANDQMWGFGGVVSFEVDGDYDTTRRFVENLKLCLMAPSLGGTETLVTQPVTSSHYFMKVEERVKAGITDQLVRLSIGIEYVEDIIADLDQAFKAI